MYSYFLSLFGIILLLSGLEKIITAERRQNHNIGSGPTSTSKTPRGISPLNCKQNDVVSMKSDDEQMAFENWESILFPNCKIRNGTTTRRISIQL